MSQTCKILVFAGSTREDSFNKKLARYASTLISQFDQVEVTFADLRDYPLPLYDGDNEINQPFPENAEKFKSLLQSHHGFLIACPEYNSSITGVLKNTIDWASRDGKGGGDLSAYTGKVAAICSASPGGLGGLRGLVHIRAILGNIGTFVIPKQLAVSSAFKAFNEQGELQDETMQEQFKTLVAGLVDACQRLTA